MAGCRSGLVVLTMAISAGNPAMHPSASGWQAQPESDGTRAAIQALLERRGPLPQDLTIMMHVEGRGYDDEPRSTLWANTTGRFLRHGGDRDSGDRGGTKTGFDGTNCWVREASGFVRELAWSDRDTAKFMAWLQTGQWLDRMDPSLLKLEPGDSTGDRAVFSVQLRGTPTRVAFSKETGLAESIRFQGVSGDIHCEYSEYRRHYGLMIPGRVKVTTVFGERESTVEAVERIASSMEYSRPAQAAPTIRFDDKLPETLAVERALSGHVLVDVVLADGAVRKFIFDTGAGGTVIDSALAEKLNLEKSGEQALASVLGMQNAKVYTAPSLSIGPATLIRPKLIGMDLEPFHETMGVRVEGIIGFDLLSQVVCEIELASNTIRVFHEANYSASRAADVDWQDLMMLQNVPVVSGRYPHGEGIFRMDVGAANGPAGNVIFHTPAVAEMKVDTSAMTVIDEVGTQQLAIGPIDWFEIGQHRFEKPVVLYSLARSGPLAEGNIEGNIGVEFLKPFRLVLDYRNARMSLVLLK
jgi:hypothetical protein